ncbi:MAG: hypothetical protein AAGE52_12525 [Myxococcota bacterium]
MNGVRLGWVLVLLVACGDDGRRVITRDTGTDAVVADVGGRDTSPRDVGARDTALNPDAACAAERVTAEVERQPVDIIWMVDNSVSMEPAIREVQNGLNDFAELVGSRDLDFRVIMLSLRGRGEALINGGRRFRVCIPMPLSDDTRCGDGERFFQVEVDIRSTQPLEQFLGTLGQTAGYRAEDDRGSEPWRDLLREGATKTIVVVSDDNSRLEPTDFENFSGGSNPFNSNELPPGILRPFWDDLFDGYTFSGIYGYGDEGNPTVRCTFSDGSMPPASGETYTTLVARTSGVRAQLCDASAWGPFFDSVATAVERRSRIDCRIPIPDPPDGMAFQRDRVNVIVSTTDGEERLRKAPSEDECGFSGGWAYDNEASPTEVVLCPTTCEAVQAVDDETRTVDVQFGCETLLI